MKLDEIIKKTGKKEWTVFSRKGKRMGSYSSMEQAEKRLKQIEYFKHLKEEEADVTWDDILKAAKKIHANLKKFDIDQIKKGFEDEKEHDEPGPEDVIKGSKENRAETLLKITLAHLKEKPDYYTRLGKAMDEAKVKVKPLKKAKLGRSRKIKKGAKKLAAHYGSNWHKVIRKPSKGSRRLKV